MDRLIYFLLFLLPFIIFPLGVSPFESPKVYVAEISIIMLLLWYLAKQPLGSLWQKKYIPFGLLGVVGIIHVVLSPSDTLIFGNAFRMMGLFLYLLLIIFAVISSKIPFEVPSSRDISFLLGAQLVAAILIEGSIDYRAVGTLGEANSLAAGTVLLLGFLLFPKNIAKDKWDEWGRALGFIIGVSIILFSGSRSGVIALAVVIVFYLIQRYSLKFALITCIFLSLVSLLLPFMQQGQLFSNRATIWQTGFTAGLMKPLIGWGPGNTEKALQPAAVTLENVLRFEYVDHTHNIFLEYWVMGGVIGLGLLLYLTVHTFRTFIQKKAFTEISILIGLLIMLSFNPMSIAVLIPYWWVIGRSFTDQKGVTHPLERS